MNNTTTETITISASDIREGDLIDGQHLVYKVLAPAHDGELQFEVWDYGDIDYCATSGLDATALVSVTRKVT